MPLPRSSSPPTLPAAVSTDAHDMVALVKDAVAVVVVIVTAVFGAGFVADGAAVVVRTVAGTVAFAPSSSSCDISAFKHFVAAPCLR